MNIFYSSITTSIIKSLYLLEFPDCIGEDGCVVLDNKGFIKTGADLLPENLSAAGWPLARHPYLLETRLPGFFAVGDVRGGNIKRVASAVGEGSIAISFVHQMLQEWKIDNTSHLRMHSWTR